MTSISDKFKGFVKVQLLKKRRLQKKNGIEFLFCSKVLIRLSKSQKPLLTPPLLVFFSFEVQSCIFPEDY